MNRHVVLKLACTSEEDQAWLLSKLSSTEKAHIKPLLDEAKALGLHKDQSVLEAISEEVNQSLSVDKNHLEFLHKATDSLGLSLERLSQLDKCWQRMLLNRVDPNFRSDVIKEGKLDVKLKEVPKTLPKSVIENLILIVQENEHGNRA